MSTFVAGVGGSPDFSRRPPSLQGGALGGVAGARRVGHCGAMRFGWLVALLAVGCLDGATAPGDGGQALDAGVFDGSDLAAPGGGATDLATAPPDLPPTPYVYVSGYSPQIARFRLDPATGALTALGTTPATGSPSFLAVDPARRHLYAVNETGNTVEAFAIDPATGGLTHIGTDQSSGGSGPAHLVVDGGSRWLLVANYTDGRVQVVPIQADGSLGLPGTPLHDCSSKAHQIVLDADNQHAFVPCLADNNIAQYTLDAKTGALTLNTPATVDAGTGPRHLALRPGGGFAYEIGETDNTIGAYAVDGAGRLTELQRVSTLPAGFMGASNGAEVQVAPSGKFVYGSNRIVGADGSIVIFAIGGDGKLTLVGHQATGKKPRHFSLDPSGRWLLVADQDSGDVRVFAVDTATGGLTPVGSPVAATMPSFVGVVPLP
jgi:6-phosphogluconolactonase